MSNKVNLSVNLNKVALIRNSRGGSIPDLVQIAVDCESYGADGITIHPRPDQRHVRYDDVGKLKAIVKTELNIEGNPTKEFMDLVLLHKPHQCTLVPDSPSALTSDSGWNTIKDYSLLRDVIAVLKQEGIRVSLFIDPDPQMVEGAKAVGADRVELYTGPYAWNYATNRDSAIAPHIEACVKAAELDIGVNAGHDLNLENLSFYSHKIPNLIEVSIGHALISDALYYGLANVIGMYQHKLNRDQKNEIWGA